MDLPRAEIRYRGGRAVAAAAIRAWFRLGSWLRPRVAPLAITGLATLCMLAGLDLAARDLRELRNLPPPPELPPIHLMPMSQPAQIIPVELAPAPEPAPRSFESALEMVGAPRPLCVLPDRGISAVTTR